MIHLCKGYNWGICILRWSWYQSSFFCNADAQIATIRVAYEALALGMSNADCIFFFCLTLNLQSSSQFLWSFHQHLSPQAFLNIRSRLTSAGKQAEELPPMPGKITRNIMADDNAILQRASASPHLQSTAELFVESPTPPDTSITFSSALTFRERPGWQAHHPASDPKLQHRQ